MERDKSILLDIARAARLVLEFRQGMDKAARVRTADGEMHVGRAICEPRCF